MAKKKKSVKKGMGGQAPVKRPAQPSPEPEPIECSTCAHFFRKEYLFGCDIEQCEYKQCKDCILKGRVGMCNSVDCMCLHWPCPACVEGTNALPLTDGRFTKEDVLSVLCKVRARLVRVETTLDRVEPALAAMTAAFDALNTR